MATLRSTFHVNVEVKKLLEELRKQYSQYSVRYVSQEKFLELIAKKLRNANLEAMSFIENHKDYKKLLKENNLEIELLPVIIIPNELFEIVEELYRKLYYLNMSFEYYTAEKKTAIVFRKSNKENIEIPVVQ